jgi:transcriptional regulator with XRE-family HTH domain
MIGKAIEAAFLRQPALARAARVSYRALRAYRLGQRTPPPAVIRRIAKALRDRGARLAKLAAELEQAAEKPSTQTGRKQ